MGGECSYTFMRKSFLIKTARMKKYASISQSYSEKHTLKPSVKTYINTVIGIAEADQRPRQKLFTLIEIHIHEIDIERAHSAGIKKNSKKVLILDTVRT